MAGLFEQPVEGQRYARVALEQGLEKPDGLTYIVPADVADLRVGDRVIVPLGRNDRPVSGYVLDVRNASDVDPLKLKALLSRDPQAVNLPDDLIELAKWISRYYCCPLGMVFGTMLPAAVKHGTGVVRKQYVDLHDPVAAVSVDSVIEQHKLRAKQAAALRTAKDLADAGKMPVALRELAELSGAKSDAPVKALIEKGLLTQFTKTEVSAIWAEHKVEHATPIVLNDEQQRVHDAVVKGLDNGFGVNLLHGVTGSGKTEVYIRIIERVVAAGRRAIVLVPEIALTPQTVGRFLGRFDRVAVLHSGLTAAQRHQQWTLIREGWADVVVGARSAVFAPMEDLGLIIVDEEHDGSYKQDQLPRYHARDVAIKRAQMRGASVLLGSATPSLESYYNATIRDSYRLLSMPNRVAGLKLPTVRLVDLLDERRKRYETSGKGGVHLLSVELESQLRRVFKDEGQAMLLLNRRGYANYIACPDHRCGWVKTCEHCDVNMVYHVAAGLPGGGLVRCHYCSFENLLPTHCPACGKKVTVFGLGTQRVEDEIMRKFPGVRMQRMDSDAMRTAQDYEKTLDRFRQGEIQLLVGTQMIAKGLDFPNVRLVGVISADTALNLPDFRAAERTFQLVCQVAGRSGRSAGGGLVVVQSFDPQHPAIQLAAKHDYVSFARDELKLRGQMNLPPVTRMARIVVRNQKLDAAEQQARQLGDVLRETNERLGLAAILHGPMPAPIARIGGFHRQQIELIAEDAVKVQKLISAVRDAGLLISDATTAVDVDPVSLL
ncbi:MAG: primosomal protein N' [Phycisphaera sp.]|nr:primosomal protein N' [Phycisphaera sp.]